MRILGKLFRGVGMQEAGSDPPANNPASQGRSNGRQGQADPAAAVEQRGGTDQALPDVPTSDALYLQQQVLQAARLYLLQQQHTEGAKGLAGSGPDKQQQLLQAPLAMAMVSPSSFTAQQLQLLQQSGLLASQPLQGLLQQQHQALALQQLQEFYKKQQEQLQMQLLQQQQQQQQLAASKSHKDVAGQHLAFQQQLLQQQQLLALQRQGLLGLASAQPSLSIQAIQQGTIPMLDFSLTILNRVSMQSSPCAKVTCVYP
uniref:Uncharacterized protein n=2 Tax=Eptatretus burgeri TaxID=7764 RepID=A0A8C4QZX6_EPTBU